MKKVVVTILVIIICSITIEQYLYYQANKQISAETNIPGELSHQDSLELSDNHEFIIDCDLDLNLNIQLLSKNFIYPFNLHPQKSLNYIWQPPEIMI
jgi:hypothetical protein